MLKKSFAILTALLLALGGAPGALAQCIIPAQTAIVKTASYTALAADAGKAFAMNCASACTLTLPSTPQSPNWFIWVISVGAGQVTVARNGLTINGAAQDLTLSTDVGSSVLIATDNTNYFAGAGNAGSSAVTASANFANGGLVKAAGANRTLASADLTGDVTTSGGTATTIANNAVTGAKMANAAVTATQLAAQYSTGNCEIHIWGTGASNVLQDTDDEVTSCYNSHGVTETITAVRCWANSGTPTVLPAVTGGSNLLSANLSCGNGSWAAGTLNGTPTLSSSSTIDENIVLAGGTATNIRIVIEFTY